MNHKLKEPVTFAERIESVQIILCGVVGTIILVVWLTSFDFIINIFKPDFIKVLSILRVGLASLGLIIASLVGLKALAWGFNRGIELRAMYTELTELNKKKKE